MASASRGLRLVDADDDAGGNVAVGCARPGPSAGRRGRRASPRCRAASAVALPVAADGDRVGLEPPGLDLEQRRPARCGASSSPRSARARRAGVPSAAHACLRSSRPARPSAADRRHRSTRPAWITPTSSNRAAEAARRAAWRTASAAPRSRPRRTRRRRESTPIDGGDANGLKPVIVSVRPGAGGHRGWPDGWVPACSGGGDPSTPPRQRLVLSVSVRAEPAGAPLRGSRAAARESPAVRRTATPWTGASA